MTAINKSGLACSSRGHIIIILLIIIIIAIENIFTNDTKVNGQF